MKPTFLKPTPRKQVLADAVLNALDEKAIKLEAVEQGDAITLTATFEHPIEEARLEVVDHALRTLRDTGVLTRSLPRVDVHGRNSEIMSIRFPNKADFCSTNEDNGPINFGRFSIRKKDRKKVGPFPIDNISPMFQNVVRPVNNNQHRNRNNRNNNRNRNHQDSDDDYGSIDSQVTTETVDYDAFYEAMEFEGATLETTFSYDDDLQPAVEAPRPNKVDENKQVTVSRLNPNLDKNIGFKFLNAVADNFARMGLTTSKAQTKNALNAWAHLWAGVGMVSQTEVIGSMDRLQNDSNTVPCSMVWITNVLSGKKSDPEIKVADKGWYKTEKREWNGRRVFVCHVRVNDNVQQVKQLNKSVADGIYSGEMDSGVKPATPLVSASGTYLGLRWN